MNTPGKDSLPLTRNAEIWILGGGTFGRRALRLVDRKWPEATTIVVDRIPAAPPLPATRVIEEEAVAWLARQLPGPQLPTAIIPAVPLHLVLEWLKRKMTEHGFMCSVVDFPDELLDRLPNPFQTTPGQAVVSHADFICPEHCPEPSENCSHTGRPRPQALHDLLRQEASQYFSPLIVRSRQFGPGVGGFLPEDLLEIYRLARRLAGEALLVGTACKCHGIIGAIRFDGSA